MIDLIIVALLGFLSGMTVGALLVIREDDDE